MNQRLRLTTSAMFLMMSVSCSLTEQHKEKNPVCSNAWYLVVEKQIMTGDNHGHGPDVGSIEWRSVVEFKLGIRGNKQNPSVSSEQWCRYIDEAYIDKNHIVR